MVDKRVIKEMGRKALKEGREALKEGPRVIRGIGEFIVYPFFLPTYLRRNDEGETLTNNIEFGHLGYGISTMILGNAFSLIAGFGYDSRFLLYPATMLATNTGSLLYEWYQGVKKDITPAPLSTPSISPPISTSSNPPLISTSSDLEKKVETKVPRDIPNPWDIDIPKIEDKKVGRNYGR